MMFKGSLENFIKNGALALEESISLFHGKTNPIRYFSVDELNAMNLEPHSISFKELDVKWYKGSWDGRPVLVKEQSEKFHPELTSGTFREILVAAQMSTHNNVHKLLGCCLETKYTVLVFEWVQNVTLNDLIVSRDKEQGEPLLDWGERLRIAWEISHVLAYLHTAFQQPIIHRSLKPHNVYLGIDNATKLSDFSLCIPLPKDKRYVHDDLLVGTFGYIAPEYCLSGRVSESTDVYAFGLLFLVLLTGKDVMLKTVVEDSKSETHLLKLVRKDYLANKCIAEIVDPSIFGNGRTNEVKQELKTSIEIALRCTEAEEDARPTMVDVASQLKNMVKTRGVYSS